LQVLQLSVCKAGPDWLTCLVEQTTSLANIPRPNVPEGIPYYLRRLVLLPGNLPRCTTCLVAGAARPEQRSLKALSRRPATLVTADICHQRLAHWCSSYARAWVVLLGSSKNSKDLGLGELASADATNVHTLQTGQSI
jgi:hypothetical protein